MMSFVSSFIANSISGGLVDHMARIDRTSNLKVDRFAPWTLRVLGPYHKVVVAPCPTVDGEIDIELAFVIANIRCPNGTQIGIHCTGYRGPVDQIARVKHAECRHIVERGERHVVVVSHTYHRWVGVVTAHDGIGEGLGIN